MTPQLAGIALVVSFHFYPLTDFKVYPKLIMATDSACLHVNVFEDLNKILAPSFNECETGELDAPPKE